MADDRQPVIFELCIASEFDALCGAVKGVDRVELNSALELGGLTPSIGMTERVVQKLGVQDIPVIAMVRPRPGGFAYDSDHLVVMRRDIDWLLEVGAHGVAFGILERDGTIDVHKCAELIKPVVEAGREAVFHRAFDFVPDPTTGLEKLVDLGVHRVMTSGGKPSAIEGSAVIRSLIEQAGSRIEVLPAGGIRPQNVAELVRETYAKQVHAALRDDKPDRSLSSNPAIELNSAPIPRDRFMAADSTAVEAMVKALKVF
ncbi:MAG: copper homeostasis protein CutC [Planctomycetota bacterium]